LESVVSLRPLECHGRPRRLTGRPCPSIPLSDQRIRQRFTVPRPEGLKPNPARMTFTRPFLDGQFRKFKSFALDDRQLSPRASNPHVPRNVSGRASHAAVLLDGMETVVERVIDLAFDQPAANPKSRSSLCQRFGIDPPGNLMCFETLLPGETSV